MIHTGDKNLSILIGCRGSGVVSGISRLFFYCQLIKIVRVFPALIPFFAWKLTSHFLFLGRWWLHGTSALALSHCDPSSWHRTAPSLCQYWGNIAGSAPTVRHSDGCMTSKAWPTLSSSDPQLSNCHVLFHVAATTFVPALVLCCVDVWYVPSIWYRWLVLERHSKTQTQCSLKYGPPPVTLAQHLVICY